MTEKSCIFCNICNGIEPATILFSDDDVIVFSDIRPASDHHYLVIPRKHIPNAKQLTKDDIPLIEKLLLTGKKILEQNLATLNDARMGFHWPPFNSVEHLHLHVISPTSNMSYISKIIFLRNSYWFVSPDYMLKRLSKL